MKIGAIGRLSVVCTSLYYCEYPFVFFSTRPRSYPSIINIAVSYSDVRLFVKVNLHWADVIKPDQT